MQFSRFVSCFARLLLVLIFLACFGAPALAQTAGHLMNSYSTGSYFVYSSPAIGVDGSILVGCGNGYLYAFDPALTGYNWRYNAGGEIDSSPAVGPTGNVYFTTYIAMENTKVLGVTSGGNYLWQYAPNSGSMLTSPAVAADGTVYAEGGDHKLYAFDGDSGDVDWQYYSVGLSGNTPAIGIRGTVYIGSHAKFSAINKGTGLATWENEADVVSDIFDSAPAIGKDGTVYAGSEGSRLYAFDWRTGKVKWTFDASDDFAGGVTVGPDGTVYIGSNDNKVYAVDGKTGAKKWEFPTGGDVRSAPAVGDDGTVYAGSVDGKMYAIDGETGTKDWEYETGGRIYCSPTLSNEGILYFTSEDGYIYGVYTSSNSLADSPWPVFGCTTKSARRYDGPYAISYPSTRMPLLSN